MSARTLTLVAVSLTLGLGAALMANNWLNGRLNAAPDDNMKNVVVATVEIPFGQMIEAQQVAIVRMPKDAVPDDAFDSNEKVVGQNCLLLHCCAAMCCVARAWPSTWVAVPWLR